jgi:hypothetical protein
VESLNCQAQWECQSVTDNYNYANCIQGTCQCLTNLGFGGNATTQNKCNCNSPYTVYWASGQPYCISYSDGSQYKVDLAKSAYQKSVVQTIYTSLIWPTPQILMQLFLAGQPSIVSVLFSETAKGRIDPAGIFTDHDGIFEYFYGFVFSGLSMVKQINFKKLISEGNMVFMSVDIFFENHSPFDPNVITGTSNLTQSGSFIFNEQGLIQSTDLIIHNLGARPDNFVVDRDPTFINFTCFLILSPQFGNCNATFDPEGHYTSMQDCINFMSSNSTPWGTWDNLYFGGNSVICRTFHSLLTIARPAVHCKHSGKTGGHVCIDHNYTTYFDQTF